MVVVAVVWVEEEGKREKGRQSNERKETKLKINRRKEIHTERERKRNDGCEYKWEGELTGVSLFRAAGCRQEVTG